MQQCRAVSIPIHSDVHIIYPDEFQYAKESFNAFFAFLELLTWGSLRRCGSWSPADTDDVRASSRGGALGLMMAALPKRGREYSQPGGLKNAQDHV